MASSIIKVQGQTAITLTKKSNVGTFEHICRRSGNVVSGCVIFQPTSTLGNDNIVDGLPVANALYQFPMICVSGSQSGQVGRVRIAGSLLQIWYSNITPMAGNTYFIPINYICD